MSSHHRIYQHAPARNRRLPDDAYATEGKAVLFTLRSYRDRPFETNDPLCDRVMQLLGEMAGQYHAWVGAYCLMPDHLHFVAGPTVNGQSVLTFVERFKGKTTNASWQFGWSGKLWQPRGHDHVLRSAEALDDTYAYILTNPVRAGLVAEPEDWPWSGRFDLE